MIAVAVAVIIGVVAVTCGIVADSNHADTLTFLGLIVKTTAAQIFLAGAICTWALFASLWLLSVGIRRSKERSLELRLLKAVRTPGPFGAPQATGTTVSTMAPDMPDLAGLTPATAIANRTADRAMSAPTPTPADSPNTPSATRATHSTDATDRPAAAPATAHAARITASTDPSSSTDPADSEPTIDFADLIGSNTFGHLHNLAD